MKKIIYSFLGMLAILSSCQEPEYVLPTANRQGITSLTAIFVEGEYAEKVAVEYKISDSSVDKFVIPIPYYYPESSDNETGEYMSKFKVQAELAPNYQLSPSLGILDLTKENYFTLTEPDGTQRKISISGIRKKSSACQLLSFALPDLGVTGSIDEDTKSVALPTLDELKATMASYTLSPHATISPDPAVESIDYNQPVKFTVTAHDGTQAVYTVEKKIPEKINYGYRAGSESLAYTIDLTTNGMPAVSHPSIAVCGGNLVVNYGDGSTPIYFNASTGGTKLGTVNLGNATATGSVTSDTGGNMLICNYAQAGESWSLYATNDVKQEPKKILSMQNTTSFPVGSRLSVTGDISSNAIITSAFDGVGAGSNQFIRCVVRNGVVGQPEIVTVSGVGYWFAMDANAKVAYRNTEVEDGYFVGHYNYNDQLNYVDGTSNTATSALGAQSDDSGWGYNNSIVSTTTFNKATYLALYAVGYFPQWGMNSIFYLYDVSSASGFSGTVDATDILKMSSSVKSYNAAEPSQPRTGDILLVPSTNGFKMSLYYVDNTCKTVGCYNFDCIKK